MTVFDYIVLVILGVSITIGLMRGAVREVLSMAGWGAAFYAANVWNADLVAHLPPQIPGEVVKVMVAFVLIFLTVLFLCSLVALLLTALVKAVGLGGTNRLLGGFAGAIKGVLLIGVLMLLAGMTDLPKDNRWTGAMLSAPLEALVIKSLPWLPEGLRRHVHLGLAEPPAAI